MNGQRTSLWIKLALLGLAAVGLVLFLASIGQVVKMIALAALVAYLLDPLAKWLEARGLSRTLATFILFAGLLLALGLFLFFFLPLVAAEVRAMQSGAEVERARALIEAVEREIEARLAFLQIEELNLTAGMRAWVTEQLAHAVNYLPSLVSVLGEMILIPFIVFFLLKDGRTLKKGFVSLIPNRYFELTLNVLHKMDVQLGNYLRGQLFISFLVGLLSIAALWLLEVDYFFLIGVLAGLTNLIPYLGPVAGAAIAVAVSAITTGTFDKALPIVAAFVLIQVIDNAFMQPLVLARKVSLHPLFILLTLVVAGQFFGFIGLLFAVPVAATLKVAAQETYDTLRRYHLA